VPIKNVSVEEASQLLEEGYVYLDVRTEEEFDAGHVPGAANVPLLVSGSPGMQPNPDFLSVVEKAFEKDCKFVVGCRSGGRSQRAAEIMAQAGFQTLCNMQGGMAGARDAFGRPLQGWTARGLPTEAGAGTGKAYSDLKG
jgi:rhodanese-related sulfurtransferase